MSTTTSDIYTCTSSEDPTGLPFGLLPQEILTAIIRYLDILDILRLRRVSRFLNEITHCRDVWSDAYRGADFVRPPGPYLSQSTYDLEHALITSFRVSQNLGNCNMGGGCTTSAPSTGRRAIKSGEIRYTGVGLCVSLVFGGRFLLIALREEIRCYDLNLDAFGCNSGASIIYRPTGGALTSFRCASAIDPEGRPFACAVFTETTQSRGQDATQISICLLKEMEQSEVAFDLLHQFERPTFHVDRVDLGRRVIVVQGRADPDVDTDWDLIAIDVHTHMQLLLPPFLHTTREEAGIPFSVTEEITLPVSISTSTHLLLAMSFYTQTAGWCTFVEAFALPHLRPDTNRRFMPTLTSTLLSPSHRGVLSGINISNFILLHDTIIDPSTHDFLITLCVHAFESSRPRGAVPKYGVLRLDGRSHHVQSAKETSLGIGTVTLELLGRLGGLSTTTNILHPSFNGAGWAFYTRDPGRYGRTEGILQALEYDVYRGGLSVNSSEAGIVDHPCALRFPSAHSFLDYDPYSGRLCFRCSLAKYSVIEIWDLAVWIVDKRRVRTYKRRE